MSSPTITSQTHASQEAGKHRRHTTELLQKNLLFALAGNQNSGKTTLFNALTGSNQHVGNLRGNCYQRFLK